MPELTIEKALELAVDAHKAGDFTEADKYYTAILKIAPNHPDANHNMGVLAVNLNKTDKSLPFFWNAVKSNPTIQQFWLSLIDTLVTLSQEAEAKSAIQQAQENGVDENALKAFLEKLKAQETTKLNLNQETNATSTPKSE